MKRIACLALLLCLLLTSCAAGGGDLNIYTTTPVETTVPNDSTVSHPIESTTAETVFTESVSTTTPVETTVLNDSTVPHPIESTTAETVFTESVSTTSAPEQPLSTTPAPEITTVVTSAPAEQTTVEDIAVNRPTVPDEFRQYISNYTFQPSTDSNNVPLYREVAYFAEYGDYIYYQEMLQSGGKSYLRLRCLNTKTGELTSPCFDPVCTHDTLDCDFCFQSPISVQSFGKYIVFYAKKEMKPTSAFQCYLYNASTGELRSGIFNQQNYSNISTYVCHSGNYLYNFGYNLYDNPNATGSNDKTVYEMQIWRYDLSSGKTETIHTLSDTYRGYTMQLVHGDRIYFHKLDKEAAKSAMYSMSLACTDVREEPNFVSAKYYVGDEQWDVVNDNGKYAVRSVNIKTGETKVVVESNKHEIGLAVTDKYVYYSIIESSDSSQLWRCDHNGNNKTRLTAFDGILKSFSVYGNYVYRVGTVKINGKSTTKAVRIHVETGEVLIIE